MKALCNYDKDVVLALECSGADLSVPDLFGCTPVGSLSSKVSDPSILLPLAKDRYYFHRCDGIFGLSLLQSMGIFAESRSTSHVRTFILNADYDLAAYGKLTGSIIQDGSLASPAILQRIIRRLPSSALQAMVDFRPENWSSPMYLAASRGQVLNTELLIKAGACLELEGGRCGTALMGACDAGKLATVKTLVRYGAKINYRNVAGENVSAITIAKYHPKVVQWLLVSRYTDQKKICQTGDVSSERKRTLPWSRSKSVEIFFPRMPEISQLQYLRQLNKARKKWAGKVYYPIKKP
jgi:ankyrin repeat protein